MRPGRSAEVGVAVLFLVLGLGSPAQAAEGKKGTEPAGAGRAVNARDASRCNDPNAKDAVDACTRIIASGKVVGDDLATLYGRRAKAYEARGELEKAHADYLEGAGKASAPMLTVVLGAAASRVQDKLATSGQKPAAPVVDPKVKEQQEVAARAQLEERLEPLRTRLNTAVAIRDIAAAESAAKSIFAQSKDDFRTLLALSTLYRTTGERAKERDTLDRLVTTNGRKWTIWQEVEFEARGGNRQAALKLADDWVAANPDAQSYVGRGRLKLALRDRQGALEDARRASEVAPDDWSSKIFMAELVEAGGDKPSAIAILKSLPSPQGKASVPYEARAAFYLRLGETELGLADLDQAIARRPLYGSYLTRGAQYAKMQEYEKAVADFRKAIETMAGRRNESAVLSLAEVYAKAGKRELALETFRSLGDTWEDPYGQRKRGLFYLSEGMVGPATADFDVAIASYRSLVAAERRRQAAVAPDTRYADDIRKLADVVRKDFAKTYAGRAMARVKSGKPQLALDDANAALDLDPDLADAYAARGEAYRVLGEAAKADADLARSKTLGAATGN